MKSGRRDVFLLTVFLVASIGLSFGLIWYADLVKPIDPVDQVIFGPLGALYLSFVLVYVLNIALPRPWGINKHGVRYIVYPDGRIEPEFSDWIKQPAIRKHFEEMKDFPITGRPGAYPD